MPGSMHDTTHISGGQRTLWNQFSLFTYVDSEHQTEAKW